VAPRATDREQAYRLLPAIDEILRDPRALALAGPRALVQELAGRILAEWREEVRSGRLDAAELERRRGAGTLFASLGELVRRDAGRGVIRAVNATGVVLQHRPGARARAHPRWPKPCAPRPRATASSRSTAGAASATSATSVCPTSCAG
jgi:hypothetical protein